MYIVAIEPGRNKRGEFYEAVMCTTSRLVAQQCRDGWLGAEYNPRRKEDGIYRDFGFRAASESEALVKLCRAIEERCFDWVIIDDLNAHLLNVRKNGRVAQYEAETGEPILEIERELIEQYLLQEQLVVSSPKIGLRLTAKGTRKLKGGSK